MKASPQFFSRPTEITPRSIPLFNNSWKSRPKPAMITKFERHGARFTIPRSSRSEIPMPVTAHSKVDTKVSQDSSTNMEAVEAGIEKVIYRFRFLVILGVFGSLVGSFLCFIKGCSYVVASYVEYFVNRSRVILLLVEAIDIYLLGTVMLVFGMGMYELFVSNLDIAKSLSKEKVQRSNLFGMFTLKERPGWLEITSVSELKTKLGHVIVMLLLIGQFEKSKIAVIQSPMDLLCFSASVLLSSCCLFFLAKLTDSK